MKRIVILFLTVFVFITSCVGEKEQADYSYNPDVFEFDNQVPETNILPRPESVEQTEGVFGFARGTYIAYSDVSLKVNGAYLATVMESMFPAGLRVVYAASPDKLKGRYILLEKKGASDKYSIDVTPKQIYISAGSSESLRYAIQSFRQLLPVEVESSFYVVDSTVKLPCLSITDSCSSKIRGFYLQADAGLTRKNISDAANIASLTKNNTFFLEYSDFSVSSMKESNLHPFKKAAAVNMLNIVPVYRYIEDGVSAQELAVFCRKAGASAVVLRDFDNPGSRGKDFLKGLKSAGMSVMTDNLEYCSPDVAYFWDDIFSGGFESIRKAVERKIPFVCFPQLFCNPYDDPVRTVEKYAGLSYKEIYARSSMLELRRLLGSGGRQLFAGSASAASLKKLNGFDPAEAVIALAELSWNLDRLPLAPGLFEELAGVMYSRFRQSGSRFCQEREDSYVAGVR